MTEYQKTYIELKKQFVATNEGPDNVRALYTFKEELEQSEDQQAKEVLVDVPGYLKPLMKLAEQVKWINSRMNLPRLNGNIRVLYIRSFYGRDEHQEALRILIAHARNQAYKQQYHFLTVGIDERSKYLRFFSSFPFQSNAASTVRV